MAAIGDDRTTMGDNQDNQPPPPVLPTDNTVTNTPAQPQAQAATGTPVHHDGQQNMPSMQQHNAQNYQNYQFGYPMGQNQQFQPTQNQPLQYPQYNGQYNGYYGNPQQFPGYYYPPPGHMPPQQMQPPPPPPPNPPQQTHQQSSGSGLNTSDTDGQGFDDNASEAPTHSEQAEEQEFFGTIADKLNEWEAQRKQDPTEGPEVYERLALFMMDQFHTGFRTQDLDHSPKDYPTLKNVPLAMAPEVEKDIFDRIDLKQNAVVKSTEVALKSIQKGIASSINAIGPLAEVIMRQSRDNPELDRVSGCVLDIIKLLSNACSGLSKKRRDLLRPHIDAKYHKLTKADDEFDHKFLFGGNLSERVKQIKATDSLMREVMKPDPKKQVQGRRNPQASGGPNRPYNQGGNQRPQHRQAPYNRNNQGRSSGTNNSSGYGNQNKDFPRKGSSHNNNNNANKRS